MATQLSVEQSEQSPRAPAEIKVPAFKRVAPCFGFRLHLDVRRASLRACRSVPWGGRALLWRAASVGSVKCFLASMRKRCRLGSKNIA